jgi:hypothetical protein
MFAIVDHVDSHLGLPSYDVGDSVSKDAGVLRIILRPPLERVIQ